MSDIVSSGQKSVPHCDHYLHLSPHPSPCPLTITESTHLSTASLSSNASSATPPESSRRPASLISTLSSGSGSSRDDTLAQSRSVDLDLSPDEDAAAVVEGQGLIQRCHNNNNNAIKEATPTRGLRRQRLQRSSPVVVRSMAPSPQLTYLDRVVMELIETERTYVRDLRMIVEVSHITRTMGLLFRTGWTFTKGL